MPTVNSNGAAMFALNKMTITERDMTTAMERLSSGKRINHAGDDAAGAAIADRMTAQIKGLEQSVRNAGDVISMAQVTEGALDESSSIIQRIRELAIQSASDVMNAEERSYLDAEVIQMMAELDRVTRDTTFNEIAVLDGSFADRRFQIGTHEREFAQLSVSSMRIDALGAFKVRSDGIDTSGKNDNLALNAYAVDGASTDWRNNLVQSEAFTIHGILGSSSVTAVAGSNVRDIASSVNAVFNSTGVSAIASTQLKLEAKSFDDAYSGQTSFSFWMRGKNNKSSIKIDSNITLNNTASSSDLSNLRDSLNNYTSTTGVTATLSSDKSSIIMVQNEGYDILLRNVDFKSDTWETGSKRTLMVTSLDNDDNATGNTVFLGDNNVSSGTGYREDVLYSGTPLSSIVIGGADGTNFANSGFGSSTNSGGVVGPTGQNLTSFGANNLTLNNANQTINSFITLTGTGVLSSTIFTLTGIDVDGNAITEAIAGGAGPGYSIVTSTKIFKTVSQIAVSGSVAGSVAVGKLNTIVNTAAMVTVTSSASSETDKTFTVVGTGMDGAALTEVITGPGANLTVTGRQIFRTIHTVTPSGATNGAITIGVKGASSVIVTGQLELSSSNSFTVIGEAGKGLFELSPGAATLDKLSGVNVKTRQSSVDALRVLDRSLDRIHKERAKLGALMSRMEKAIDNLSNVALNTNASRGRIQDADFAKESARLTKAQILQQSAMAMIAQAGKAQQNVLQLLQQ